MSKDRCANDEYRHCEGLKAEIQIRSILQHGWAEIEHDLGYKTNISLPNHLRRRLSLLSGLLELADSAFLTIRDELKKYENELPTLIQYQPEKVLIDKVSLDVLTALNDEIGKYDKAKNRGSHLK